MVRPLLAVIALVCGFIAPVAAHDIYTTLKNPRGEPCCGGNDCEPYEGTYEATRGGYRLGDGTFVPADRVSMSPDSRAHRCIWGQQTRCLLLPMTD